MQALVGDGFFQNRQLPVAHGCLLSQEDFTAVVSGPLCHCVGPLPKGIQQKSHPRETTSTGIVT
jgi:hypothetical protein